MNDRAIDDFANYEFQLVFIICDKSFYVSYFIRHSHWVDIVDRTVGRGDAL